MIILIETLRRHVTMMSFQASFTFDEFERGSTRWIWKSDRAEDTYIYITNDVITLYSTSKDSIACIKNNKIFDITGVRHINHVLEYFIFN